MPNNNKRTSGKTNTHKNTTGQALRKTRRALKISPQELAAKCQKLGLDFDEAAITRIEEMKRRVADYELVLLAQALEVAPAEIMPARPGKHALLSLAKDRVAWASRP